LNREFYADRPNEKWLTDVTAFKYYDGPVIKKLYLSAFLDLYDRRIVAYKPVGLSNLPDSVWQIEFCIKAEYALGDLSN